MNRVIRFRVWDIETKTMSHPFALFGEFTLMGAVHDWQSEMGNKGDSSLMALNDLEIMQFTGLKDKNGKEIYEGDIVMFLDRDWADYEKDTKRLPVAYENDGFILKDTTENKYGEFYTYPLHKDFGRDRFEVIGNIYEPPTERSYEMD